MPKTNTHTRLACDLLKVGEKFEEKLIKYVRPMVIKGVPALMTELRTLYKDEAKVKVIGRLLTSMLESMEKEMVLDPKDEEEQDPTVQLWLYYFVSQHYLYINQPDEALAYINKAIDHTPTVCDLFLLKAKIYQYMGNKEQAAKLAEEARCLDSADRNLNFESAKYQLKMNEVERANDLMAMFSYEVWKGQDLNIHEMQTMWFEYHASNAFYNKKEYRLSLKQIGWIEKHYDTMIEDCLEFNNYALRKGSVNHHIAVVELIHNIYSGHYASKCCINICKSIFKI